MWGLLHVLQACMHKNRENTKDNYFVQIRPLFEITPLSVNNSKHRAQMPLVPDFALYRPPAANKLLKVLSVKRVAVKITL